MQIRRCALATFIAACLHLSSGKVNSQEALRASMSAEQMAATRRTAVRARDYNLAIGPLDLSFDAGTSMEWNDNVRLQSGETITGSTEPGPGTPPPRFLGLHDAIRATTLARKESISSSTTTQSGTESDFIFRPGMNMRGVWPVTELNTLYFSVGAAYQKYLNESDLDRFTITPESHTAFDIYIGHAQLSIFDRFSYNTDPLAEGSVSGVGDFGRLDNQAGLNAIWDLNLALLSGGYSHQNSFSSTSQFAYTDHAAEMFWVRSGFKLQPGLVAGVDSSVGLTRYDQPQLNDSINYTFGGFLTWTITDSIKADASVGYSIYNFDKGSGLFPVENVDGMYFDLTLSHVVNRWMTHQLNAGRRFNVGINSDLQDTYAVRYVATLRFIRDLTLNLDAGYELGNEPFFLAGESYERYLVGLTTGYQIMKNLTASVSYRFTTKTSDTSIRDYEQNQVTLSLSYKF